MASLEFIGIQYHVMRTPNYVLPLILKKGYKRWMVCQNNDFLLEIWFTNKYT